MAKKVDYSLLDQPNILRFIFLPRKGYSPQTGKAIDYIVPVAEDISVGCRFYPVSEEAPSILYFHGNGELVYDYDDIALLYNAVVGANLFVADYRGYGRSNGTPSFTDIIADAFAIFEYFQNMLKAEGYTGPLFVMGRSLGSLSAVDIAGNYAKDLKGLIIESGFASIAALLMYLEVLEPFSGLEEFENANGEKLRSITIPALIIHGEADSIVPFDQGEALFSSLSSPDKMMLAIPYAGHNDIMLTGMEEYFKAILEFVSSH